MENIIHFREEGSTITEDGCYVTYPYEGPRTHIGIKMTIDNVVHWFYIAIPKDTTDKEKYHFQHEVQTK